MTTLFLDELKATVPVHPMTEATAEIIARIGSEQAANGIKVPLADLIIGACALERGYAIAEGETKCSCRILSEPVEKPAVGFGDDGEGRVPPPRRMREQPHRLSVAAIGAIENA